MSAAALSAPTADTMRELLTAVLESPGCSPDPADVSRDFLDRLDPDLYRDALRVCLHDWVRNQMGAASRRSTSAPQKKSMTSPQRIASWYGQQLGRPMFVGSAWKFLRDCTAEDLHAAAAERYRKATETRREGDRWASVATFMEDNDRETVAQVSADELKKLMETA